MKYKLGIAGLELLATRRVKALVPTYISASGGKQVSLLLIQGDSPNGTQCGSLQWPQ